MKREVWMQFVNDQELLDTYRVTQDEIDTLRTFAPFGQLDSVKDILFVLNRIRNGPRR